MNRSKSISRATAQAIIKNNGYKLLLNFVSACFEDIYLYYKRDGKDYYVVWYEENFNPGDNALYHCNLKGFINKFFLYYREDSGSPAKDDMEFIEKARPNTYTELMEESEWLDTRILRLAIEDEDTDLEKAVVAALPKED